MSAQVVLSELRDLGSTGPVIREGAINKAGPIKTDQDNFIVDAPFPKPLIVVRESIEAKANLGVGTGKDGCVGG